MTIELAYGNGLLLLDLVLEHELWLASEVKKREEGVGQDERRY